MDIESRSRWVEFSKAKDRMFAVTDTKHSPWYVVNAEVKRHAQLNCIHHLLSMVDYQDLSPSPIELPLLSSKDTYVRPPIEDQTFIPEMYPKK